MHPSPNVPTLASLQAENAALRARLQAAERRHDALLAASTQGLGQPPGLGRHRHDDPAPAAADAPSPATAEAEQDDSLPLAARALLHELAQPLNTIACYAVAARNLAAKTQPDGAALGAALRGIDQQIQRTGVVVEQLRELFRT